MDALNEIANSINSLILVALIFGVYGCAVYIYNTSKSIKPWGTLTPIAKAQHIYPTVKLPATITSARRKPNIWERFMNSTGFMFGFVAMLSLIILIYASAVFLYMSFGAISIIGPYIPILLLCFIVYAPIEYAASFFLHFGISLLYYLVAMLILKCMNKKIPAGKIYRTTVYSVTPMFMVNAFYIHKYMAPAPMELICVSIAITAGLMFFAIRHIWKKQESKWIYICPYSSSIYFAHH